MRKLHVTLDLSEKCKVLKNGDVSFPVLQRPVRSSRRGRVGGSLATVPDLYSYWEVLCWGTYVCSGCEHACTHACIHLDVASLHELNFNILRNFCLFCCCYF